MASRAAARRSRRGQLIACVVVVVCPFIRVGEWELLRAYGDGIGHRFGTVADAIAKGCVLAGPRPYLHRSRHYLRFLASPWLLAVPVVVIAGNLTHDHPLVHFGVGMTLVNVGVMLCLDWCVTYPEGRVGRVLNLPPLVYLGWLSYSLYLWQQPFLDRDSTAAVAAFPLNTLLAVTLALVSYYLVERPSLGLRRTGEQRRTRRVHPAAGRGIATGVPEQGGGRAAALLRVAIANRLTPPDQEGGPLSDAEPSGVRIYAGLSAIILGLIL